MSETLEDAIDELTLRYRNAGTSREEIIEALEIVLLRLQDEEE